MKHRATLTVIFGVIAVACFFFVTELNGSSYEVMGFTFFGSIMLIWANFVAGESWLTEKGLDVGLYPDSRNPLYLQGFFRKYSWENPKESIFSGLKGCYFYQVHRVIQAVALLLYGIYNHYIFGGKENKIVLGIFAVWVISNFVVEAVVKTRYVSLLRSERPGKKYYPFQYRKCTEEFNEKPSEYICSQENLKHMQEFFREEILNGTMKRSKIIPVDEKTSVCFYYTEQGNTAFMYAKVRTDSIKKEKLPELDRMFQEFAEDHIQDKAQEKEWYCMLVFITDTSSECFLDLMEKSIFQGEKKYRLPVGICLRERKIYIPNQKELYKMDKYQFMEKKRQKIFWDFIRNQRAVFLRTYGNSPGCLYYFMWILLQEKIKSITLSDIKSVRSFLKKSHLCFPIQR